MAADLSTIATVRTFIVGFQAMQRFNGSVDAGEVDGIRYLVFMGGRRNSRFTHEYFPHDIDPIRVITSVGGIDSGSHHLISVISADGESHIPAYLAAGYEHWGNEMVMACDLTIPLPTPSSEVDLRLIPDRETAGRIVGAQHHAGLTPHPITPDHIDASEVLQRWVSVEGEVAAFGRMVIVDRAAYLCDVVTLPAFRRRGLADALVRRLLLDAQVAGADRCVLTSSEMALRLYRSIGFVDIIPLVGFQTPLS